MIHQGDCIAVMRSLDANSVDAVVCDPPYGIGFMGKEWDDLAAIPHERKWNKRERNNDVDRDPSALTPAGRSATNTGFSEPNPRCAICGKVRQGEARYVCKCGDDWTPAPRINREAQRSQEWHQQWAEAAFRVAKPGAYLLAFGGTRTYHRLAVAVEDAGWIIRDCLVWAYAQGFPKSRALLKPAWEPIVMARKPGPLRELAIDACRIPTSASDRAGWYDWSKENVGRPKFDGVYTAAEDGPTVQASEPEPLGRWPANVVLTDPIFDGGVDGVVGGGETGAMPAPYVRSVDADSEYWGQKPAGYETVGYGDTGTYSRFFLIPKAARAEREPTILPAGHDRTQRFTTHPTIKPVDLMRHLVRLVTPRGGTVLDPFLGSGTTAIAAEMEGFAWIGVEREAEYVAIAEARLMGVQKGLGLDVPAPTPIAPKTHPDLSKHQPKRRTMPQSSLYGGGLVGNDLPEGDAA